MQQLAYPKRPLVGSHHPPPTCGGLVVVPAAAHQHLHHPPRGPPGGNGFLSGPPQSAAVQGRPGIAPLSHHRGAGDVWVNETSCAPLGGMGGAMPGVGVQLRAVPGVSHSTVSNPRALFCLACDNPMAVRLRMDSCFHVVCSECFDSAATDCQRCPVCSVPVKEPIYLHPCDSLFFCDRPLCHASFLNGRSLQFHQRASPVCSPGMPDAGQHSDRRNVASNLSGTAWSGFGSSKSSAAAIAEAQQDASMSAPEASEIVGDGMIETSAVPSSSHGSLHGRTAATTAGHTATAAGPGRVTGLVDMSGQQQQPVALQQTTLSDIAVKIDGGSAVQSRRSEVGGKQMLTDRVENMVDVGEWGRVSSMNKQNENEDKHPELGNLRDVLGLNQEEEDDEILGL